MVYSSLHDWLEYTCVRCWSDVIAGEFVSLCHYDESRLLAQVHGCTARVSRHSIAVQTDDRDDWRRVCSIENQSSSWSCRSDRPRRQVLLRQQRTYICDYTVILFHGQEQNWRQSLLCGRPSCMKQSTNSSSWSWWDRIHLSASSKHICLPYVLMTDYLFLQTFVMHSRSGPA